MRNILKILTPENVYLDFELACVGSRFGAALIDHIIQGFIVGIINYMLLQISMQDLWGFSYNIYDIESIFIAIAVIIIFVVIFFYFVFFEIILNGQTIGKKIFKLKVLKETGEPISLTESVIRNFTRILHMIPFLYLIDLIFILLTKKYKRLGDYLANTIVVKLDRIPKNINLLALEKSINKPINNVQSDLFITKTEYELLEEYLKRANSIGQKKYDLGNTLRDFFSRKFNIKVQLTDTRKFLFYIYSTANIKNTNN